MAWTAVAGHVVECFWSGVREEDLPAIDRRIRAAAAQVVAGERVRYLGCLLILDDEVVLCLFEGPIATVREVTQRAGVPFERILRSSRTACTRRRT